MLPPKTNDATDFEAQCISTNKQTTLRNGTGIGSGAHNTGIHWWAILHNFSIKHGHVENKSNKLLYLSLTSPPPFNVDGGRFECNRAT